jgi:hypothetical protein
MKKMNIKTVLSILAGVIIFGVGLRLMTTGMNCNCGTVSGMEKNKNNVTEYGAGDGHQL